MHVFELGDPRAADPRLAGAKAANLAIAAAAGLPVLPGFVISTAAVARGGPDDHTVLDQLRLAWGRLGGASTMLVVRSSSTVEDAAESSLAGRFTSVLDVRGWEPMLDAVRQVMASAAAVPDPAGRVRPMAVLVQQQLEPSLGGVLFGVDPVAGDRDHLVVEAVPQRPDILVSGRTTAAHLVLTRRGRVVEAGPAEAAALLGRGARRHLARLARATETIFGGPQDIEWAVDPVQETLWLLQTRPVTAISAPATGGVLLGPGPLAETFPEPLSRLEEDLWIVPVRDAITRALRSTQSASERRIRGSPVCVVVRGRPAVDLDLLGIVERKRRIPAWLRPLASMRRLAAAWRVGHLRVAVPGLARELIARIDDDLASIPALAELPSEAITDLLAQLRDRLALAHTYEMLAGMLLRESGGGTAAGAALRALADGRARGRSDPQIIHEDPIVLTLVAPRLEPTRALPVLPSRLLAGGDGAVELTLREALRVRTRWIQELTARGAWLVGQRLGASGALPSPDAVRELSLPELSAVARGAATPPDLGARMESRAGPPLPSAFRLTAADVAMPVRSDRRGHRGEGFAAGGGRATGVVASRVRPGTTAPGTVLVVGDLEPGLAPVLACIEGLIAERGSALSHLAILAREAGVATVVGVTDARRRFPPGTRVLVDGFTGEVRVLEEVTPR